MGVVSLPDPVARLAATLGGVAGAPVELERPGDVEHGDYATNVALRLAGARRLSPRDIAAEIAAQAARQGIVEAAEAAGPAS